MGAFAAVFAALYVAHQVGDHWVQTDREAGLKGQPGWAGRLACAWHVATYSLTAMGALGVLQMATGTYIDSWALTAGLAVSAITHYIADRRTPLRKIAQATGHRQFVDVTSDGISGPYLLDQSWHIGWLGVSALIIATGTH